jgi:hypothetical protein
MRKLLAFLLILIAVPAFAEKKKAEEPGTHVEMPFLIAPMSVDGKLKGYAYISSKLTTSSPAASVEVREKLAFILDAFVRDVNAAPIAKPDAPTEVDRAALASRLVGDARRIVGNAKVVAITFTQIQFSPLHPKPATDDGVPPPERAAQTAATEKPSAKTP